MGTEESLALAKKKMVEYEQVMKELGRIKKWNVHLETSGGSDLLKTRYIRRWL